MNAAGLDDPDALDQQAGRLARSPAFDEAVARLLEQLVSQLSAVHRAELAASRLAWQSEVASVGQEGTFISGGASQCASEQETPATTVAPVRATEASLDRSQVESQGFGSPSNLGRHSNAPSSNFGRHSNDVSESNENRLTGGEARAPSKETGDGSLTPRRSARFGTLISRGRSFETVMSSQTTPKSGSLLERFVDGVAFEAISSFILFGFCIVIGVEMHSEGLALGHERSFVGYGDPADSCWGAANRILKVAAFVLGFLFALETLLRIAAKRCAFFHDFWNIMDLVLLVGWATELAGQGFRSQILRPVRMLRAMRLIRMVKYINRLDSLYFMVRALTSCMRLIGWVSLLLFAMQLLTAFIITELLFTYYFTDPSHPLEQQQEVYMYWGTFPRSLLTTFEMAMANWPIPARVLFENVSEWFIIVCLAHKLIVGFAIIGVINAVLTQETFLVAATDDLTMVLKKERHLKHLSAKMAKLFNAADTSCDGVVSKEEFRAILAHNDVKIWLASMDFDTRDPDLLFNMLDKDGTGDLSSSEFVQGLLHLRGNARALDLAKLEKGVMGFGGESRVCSPGARRRHRVDWFRCTIPTDSVLWD